MAAPEYKTRPPEDPLAVVFMDLDDTIFQTARKCRPGPLKAAAWDRDGLPSSYCNLQQSRLLDLWAGRALVIPTTARNRGAFERVHLQFGPGAILNYGGLILGPDGRTDQRWHERMRLLCAEAAPRLAEALVSAGKIIRDRATGCRARIIGDEGLDFYVVIKNYNSRIEELATVRNEMKEFSLKHGLRISLNDNNLSLRPPFLDKSEAVEYFIRTYIRPERPDLPIIGMGDSFSDLKFMQLCDFMLIPGGSQAAALLKEPSWGPENE